MQKLSKFLIEKLNKMGLGVHQLGENLKKKKVENSTNQKKKKLIKNFRKSLKKIFKKGTVIKLVIIIATLSMLLPLILPFIG